METLVINLEQIKRALPSADKCIRSMAEGFMAFSLGRAYIAPVQHLHFPKGDTCVKSGFRTEEGSNFFVTKVASSHPDNVKLGLNSSSGVMLLFSQDTGKLKGVLLDDGYLTDLRTAAAGSLAVKCFGPREVFAIGVIGTGTQARFQLDMIRHVTSCRKVIIWGRNEEKLATIKADIELLGFEVITTVVMDEVTTHCNVIITTTTSTAPLISATQLKPGVLIVAVGADGGDKQELDPDIFRKMDLVLVDSSAQCCAFGEVSHAIRAGVIDTAHCHEIGSVLDEHTLSPKEGMALVRAGDEKSDGTLASVIFDSTGLAIQDAQIAEAVFTAISGSQSVIS